jgi:hypothetical protein
MAARVSDTAFYARINRQGEWLFLRYQGDFFPAGIAATSDESITFAGREVDRSPRGEPILFTPRSAIVLNVHLNCTAQLSALNFDFPAAGGTSRINVAVNSSDCAYALTNLSTFIRLGADSRLRGSASIDFEVLPNPKGEPRTGLLRIADRFITVRQEGAILQAPDIPALGTAYENSGAVDVVVRYPTVRSGGAPVEKTYLVLTSTPNRLEGPACLIEYSVRENVLRLRDDAGTSWLGPAALRTRETLENSRCAVVAQQTFYALLDEGPLAVAQMTYSVRWKGDGSHVYAHAQSTSSSTGYESAWMLPLALPMGAGARPEVLQVSPVFSWGPTQKFSVRFRNATGGMILFAPTPTRALGAFGASCSLSFDTIQRRAGGAFGCDKQITDAQITVEPDLTATVSATLALTPPSQYAAFIMLGGLNELLPFTQVGAYRFGDARSSGPSVQVTASRDSGASAAFTLTASHTGHASDLIAVHLRIAGSITGSPYCHVVFDPLANTIGLIDDSGQTLLGNFHPGAGSAANSVCRASGEGAVTTYTANSISLRLPIEFQPEFQGDKYVLVNAMDRFGYLTFWNEGARFRVEP